MLACPLLIKLIYGPKTPVWKQNNLTANIKQDNIDRVVCTL